MVVENQIVDRNAVVGVLEILSACASAMKELNVAITRSSTHRADRIIESEDLLYIRSNASLVFESFHIVRNAIERIASKPLDEYEIGLIDAFKMIGLLTLDIIRGMIEFISSRKNKEDIRTHLNTLLTRLNRIVVVEYGLWRNTSPSVRITPFATHVSNIAGIGNNAKLQTSRRDRLDWDKAFLESIPLGDEKIREMKESGIDINTWSIYILELSNVISSRFNAQKDIFELGEYVEFNKSTRASSSSNRSATSRSSSSNNAPTNPVVMVGLLWFVRETFNKTNAFMNDFRKADVAYRVSLRTSTEITTSEKANKSTVAQPSEMSGVVSTVLAEKNINSDQPKKSSINVNQPPPNATNTTPFLFGREYKSFLEEVARGLINVKQIYDIVIDNIAHIKQFKLRADQVDGFKVALRVCCSWLKWCSYAFKTMTNPQWHYYAAEDVNRGMERVYACFIHTQTILRRDSSSSFTGAPQSISSNSKTISDLINIIAKDESLPQRDQILNPFLNDNPREYDAFVKVFEMALSNSRSIDSVCRLFAIYSSGAFYVALRPAELYLLRNLHLKRLFFPLPKKKKSASGDENEADLDENGESNAVSADENSMQGIISRMFGAVGGFAKRHAVKMLVILVSILAAGAVLCVYYPDAFKQMVDWMKSWLGDSISSALAASWAWVAWIYDKASNAVLSLVDSLRGYERSVENTIQKQTNLDEAFLNRTASINKNSTEFQNLWDEKLQASREIHDDFISDTQRLQRVLEGLEREEFDPLRLNLTTNQGAYVSPDAVNGTPTIDPFLNQEIHGDLTTDRQKLMGLLDDLREEQVDNFLNQYHDTYTYVNDTSNIINETYRNLDGIVNGTGVGSGLGAGGGGGSGFGSNIEIIFQDPSKAIGAATPELTWYSQALVIAGLAGTAILTVATPVIVVGVPVVKQVAKGFRLVRGH